jgi:hypothetical protein
MKEFNKVWDSSILLASRPKYLDQDGDVRQSETIPHLVEIIQANQRTTHIATMQQVKPA